ncbi:MULTISPECIES: hypothetical protein [unclassified Ensifer]|uniref:hypothetical protein n=1 Tax=unclassified Ensifer TaxID=2633371 RepID=UPI000813798D|nr:MULTISPECIES: hypothetical protein [unclassified Ensifer]OCP18116.1 hypothetical protein BC363_08800 [Ensifer sp. LC384]OCP27725.1 hypothetical protein BC361_13335 [Ensifer sp. LC54]
MTLLRAIHATKVLALAGLLVATACLPVRAGDWGGPPEVQTRSRHIRLHSHRSFTRHQFERMGYRATYGRNQVPRNDWTAQNGPPEVETRGRHIRLPRYRPYDRHYTERRHYRDGWGRDQAMRNIWTSGDRYDYRPDIYGGDGLPDTIGSIGTYVGGISAYRDPGNGIYFSQEGNYRYYDDGQFAPPQPVKRAKIIVVSPKTFNHSCAWEHGVCVIRR